MKHFLAISLAVLVYFAQAPKYVFRFWNYLPDVGDSFINTWILAWDAHALFDPALSVWDAPIFFPVENALAFSENLLGNLWLTMPIQYLTGNPVLASNMLFLAAFVLSSYCVYLLTYELTGHFGASLIAGLVFSFNPYRWSHAAHLQLLPIFWTPLAFLFAIRFFRNFSKSSFYLMLLMIWMQFYSSIYLGTMLYTTLGIFAIFYFSFAKKGKDRFCLVLDLKQLKLMLIGLGASVLILLPLGMPYIEVARRWNFFRSLRENSIYSAEPLGFILGIPGSWDSYEFLKNIPMDIRLGEGAVFLGLVPIFLVISNRILNAYGQNLYSDNQKILQRSFFWTGLILMVLMLGPYLILFNQKTSIPMPYQLVYYLVPGAKAMRVPARFFQPLMLCFSVLAAFSISGFMKKSSLWPGWKQWLTIGVFFGFLCFDYSVRDSEGGLAEPADQMPQVYSYLMDGEQKGPVLEIPIMRSPHKYLHYQTKHWRPTIGGVSGWITPDAQRMARVIDPGPSRKALRIIAESLADTVVIHLNLYTGQEREKWVLADLSGHGFSFAGRFEDALVWERHRDNLAESILRRVGSPDRKGKISIEYEGQALEVVKGAEGRLSVETRTAGTPGTFRQVFLENGIALLAPNGRYLSVDSAGGTIAADKPSIGESEVFIKEPAGDNSLLLRTPEGLYLVIEGGVLITAREKPGQGNVFKFEYVETDP
jgi:hypothetical protein